MKRKINKRWLWTLLVLTLTLLGAVPAAAAEEQEQVVLQGVWLGEVEISGMTADEVEAEAEKQIERALQQGIQMQMNLHTVTINVQDLGLTVEKGDVEIEGKLDAFLYSDMSHAKGSGESLLGRLFK